MTLSFRNYLYGNISIMRLLALFTFAIVLTLTSCTKTTNNTTVLSPTPSYTVDGISNITIDQSTFSSEPVSMPITIAYHDSTQQPVTVSITGVPSGAFCGTRTLEPLFSTGPWIGYPSFTIDLIFFYNNTTYIQGTYPVTINCTSASGNKTYTFNLTLQ